MNSLETFILMIYTVISYIVMVNIAETIIQREESLLLRWAVILSIIVAPISLPLYYLINWFGNIKNKK
jgi:uncharacterized membrane protein